MHGEVQLWLVEIVSMAQFWERLQHTHMRAHTKKTFLKAAAVKFLSHSHYSSSLCLFFHSSKVMKWGDRREVQSSTIK